MIRVSYALNKYYEQTGKRKDICTFQGRGEIARLSVDLNTMFSTDGLLNDADHEEAPQVDNNKLEDEAEADDEMGANEDDNEEQYTKTPEDHKKPRSKKATKDVSKKRNSKPVTTPSRKVTSNASTLALPFERFFKRISHLIFLGSPI